MNEFVSPGACNRIATVREWDSSVPRVKAPIRAGVAPLAYNSPPQAFGLSSKTHGAFHVTLRYGHG